MGDEQQHDCDYQKHPGQKRQLFFCNLLYRRDQAGKQDGNDAGRPSLSPSCSVCGGAAGLLPLVLRGVDQSSRFDYISTLGSPSITSLLFSSHFFLSCDLSHFCRFSQVLKRNIMTYDVP
jgi:hypothetical protein